MALKPISHEFHLARYKNGVILVKPGDNESSGIISDLATLIMLPYSVYVLDKEESKHLVSNEECARLLNADSVHETIGKNMSVFADNDHAAKIWENDKRVLTTETSLIIEEEAEVSEEKMTRALTFKFPCYQNEQELLGIFGISISLDKQSLGQGIAYIANLGLLQNLQQTLPASSLAQKFPHLTKRERQILESLVKGMSARMIGTALYISHRTVEHHIENIKTKLNVKNKFDLIDIYEKNK